MESTPTSESGSSSSEMLCSICLGTMKPGHGEALFTAECSHVFHFHCIASNVKHGNQSVCPVCRSKWKAIPFQDPAADVVRVRSRISPSDSPQDGRWMAFFRRLTSRGRHSDSGRRYNPVFQDTGHRSNPVFEDSGRQSNPALQDSGCRSNPVFHATDSNAYNDDEHLDTSLSEIPASESKEGLTKTVEMETFVGLPAVSASDCRDSFSVLIHLKAPSVGQRNGDRAPVDLVTVLDVSGSMEGTKISLLKRAMGFVIQNLGPFDRLSVVSFSSTARRLFHLRRMTDSGHERALRAVNSLVAGGTTNIVEGLSKGAKVLEDRREKNPVCSIILLSDGRDNHNVRRQSRRSQNFDYQAFLPLSHIRGGSQQWQTQMPVHTFGFGADHEASLMHSISEASGGTFSFIETESMIQDAFAQCIGGLLSVAVQDLQVRLECVSPGVSINSIHAGSYAGRVFDQGQKGLVEAGDLYAEEERDFIVEVRIPASSMTSDPLHGEILVVLKVGCVYKDPVLQKPTNVDAKQVVIQRPESVSPEENIVCIEVDRQKNRLKASEAMAEASALAEQDNLAGAVVLLGNQRKALSQSVAAKAGDGLCMALDAELKEMQERMASRQVYEASGRSYIFSGLSAHSQQRATTRGVSTDGTSTGYGYHTPLMVDMLKHSQTWSTSSHDHPRP